MKIYESVNIPSEKLNKYKRIDFYRPTAAAAGEDCSLDPKYTIATTESFIHGGYTQETHRLCTSPSLSRYHIQVFCRADGKLLGKFVQYSRSGGTHSWLKPINQETSETHYSCQATLEAEMIFSEPFSQTPLLKNWVCKNESPIPVKVVVNRLFV